MKASKKHNVILDIDGTLIDSIPWEYTDVYDLPDPDIISPFGDFVYIRPYLKQFLKFCFSNFKNVAIWTAGDKRWAEFVISKILLPCLQSSKKQKKLFISRESDRSQSPLRIRGEQTVEKNVYRTSHSSKNQKYKFSFVFSYEKCRPLLMKDRRTNKVYEYCSKPLYKVWRTKSLKKMGFNRSNTLIVEDTPENCIYNYGNAIYIRPFDILSGESRNDQSLLKLRYFFDELNETEDVRYVEKRDWERRDYGSFYKKVRKVVKSESKVDINQIECIHSYCSSFSVHQKNNVSLLIKYFEQTIHSGRNNLII